MWLRSNTDFVPNYADISEGIKGQEYNSLDGQPYGVPHGRGPNYLMFRTDEVPEDTDSWAVVWEDDQLAKYKGKISIYDASDFIADAALYLKATQPDLGIDSPYQLDAGAVRRCGRAPEEAGSERRRVLARRRGQADRRRTRMATALSERRGRTSTCSCRRRMSP